MALDYWRGMPIYDDSTPEGEWAGLCGPDGERYQKGFVPREHSRRDEPTQFGDPPTSMTVFPESELEARIAYQDETKSSLEHLYLGEGLASPKFVNLDQNGDGYCWAYSTGSALMLSRLKANLTLLRLNPHATAAIIKRGRDEGGWCGLSGKWARENGYAVQGTGAGQWKEHSRDLSQDTPALRAQMALHKSHEEWVDLTQDVYDVSMTWLAYCTALLSNCPCPSDYNWWGHSVCALRLVRIEAGRLGVLILNSWKGWGRFGLGVLSGSKMNYASAYCIRSSVPSDV